MPEACSWCSTTVADDDGFRVGMPDADQRAVFCRLEHVVPWIIQGADWDAGRIVGTGEPSEGLGRCALCGDSLGPERVLVVRHRGRHRIADAFCRLDHLLEWAKGGGRYRAAS
jgi:hypothetical protein